LAKILSAGRIEIRSGGESNGRPRNAPAPERCVSSDTRKLSGKLFHGDSLEVAALLPSNSFRLIYLDPPFLTGKLRSGPDERYSFPDEWAGKINDYIPWLRERIRRFHDLLLPDGSLVLHLDWRVAHYAKVMLDEIFGYEHFMNEIIWHYTGGGRSKRRFSCKHDTLLWYAKGQQPVFNLEKIRVPYKQTSRYAHSGIVSAAGKLYMPNPKGTPVDDVWDLPIINPLSRERVGYPTQKPVALLERLVEALSNTGDLIADLFCGSGTTLVAAQKLARQWIGGDISPDAVSCARKRLDIISSESTEVIDLISASNL